MPPSLLTPLGHFIADTLKGIFMFVVMTAAAVGLNVTVRYFQAKQVDAPIIWGLTAAEYAMFAVDLIILFRFLLTTLITGWYHFSLPTRR